MSSFRLSRSNRAFTLIELIVTVVILAVLAALAVPALQAVKDRSRDAVDQASVEAIGREAAALAAFDSTAVGVAHLEEAVADTSSAADTVSATSLYVRDGHDGDLAVGSVGPGEFAFLGYAGLDAYAVFVPRHTSADRAVFLQVTAATATARWADADADTDGTPHGPGDAGAAFALDAVVQADDGTQPPSGSASSTPSVLAPDAPTGVSAQVNSSDVTVAWTAVAASDQSPVDGYRVYRQPSGQDLWTVDAVIFDGTVTSHTDAARPDGSWCYRVSAYGAGGESTLTASVCASVLSPAAGDGSVAAGTSETMTVPAGVQAIDVTLTAGHGGPGGQLTDSGSVFSPTDGGRGAKLVARIPVVAGDEVVIRTGTGAQQTLNKYGGMGGWSDGVRGSKSTYCCGVYTGGGGGGSTEVTVNATVVASTGGGGGGGAYNAPGGAGGGVYGGNGGPGKGNHGASGGVWTAAGVVRVSTGLGTDVNGTASVAWVESP